MSVSAHQSLRAHTADDHARVDGIFGGFDLADAGDYGRFLTAHARALPAVEAAIAGHPALPPLRSRVEALAADLDGLGLAMPAPLPIAPPANAAEAFGMAYVIEGSRLGGAMLARSVREDLPRAYLQSAHLPGEWRGFGQAMDAAAGGDADWIARAAAAANRTFTLYAEAARPDELEAGAVQAGR